MSAIMFPEDIYLPQSTAFPERDIKGISPKSIYQITSSHPARLHSERVGDFVMSRIFG
jgi:chromosome partitioning protein